jgi:hypothetical protein
MKWPYSRPLMPMQNQYIPGNHAWSFDASLFKDFQIKERLVVRFTADFFNALNHPNNPNAGSDGFLRTDQQSNAARTTQLSLRATW